MKLISLPISPYAARVRGAIYAKQLLVEIVYPGPNWRASGELTEYSPVGRIPVLLLDDGTAIPESRVIVDLLEDMFPQIPLRPVDPLKRAKADLIRTLLDLYVCPHVAPIYTQLHVGEAFTDTLAIDRLLAGLRVVEAYLSSGYACGSDLSVADLWLVTARFQAGGVLRGTGRDEALEQVPRFRDYVQVVHEDPVLGRVWNELQKALEHVATVWRGGVAFDKALEFVGY